MRTRVLILFLVAAAVPDARAWVQYLTASGQPLSWDVPAIELLVAPETPLGIGPSKDALDAGIAAWMAIECDAPTLTARVDATAALSPDDQRSSVVWVPDPAVWNERFSSLELARTILIHRAVSGRIVDADIAVNVGGFAFSTGACEAERYDLQGALTHELGHLFGLDHSLDPEATMKAKEVAGDCEMRTLAADDVAGFCATYDVPDRPEPTPEAAEPVEGADGGEVVEALDGGDAGADGDDAVRGDDGCHGAAPPLVMSVAAWLALRRARRASARCR